MAMLAEVRKRQKLSVNPRGTAWVNDDSKFGQKLMERMGWSKGKGLGANEDGRKESVTVKFKNDTKGVGCSKSSADSWLTHQDDFNSLLADLNSSTVTKEETVKVTSLEEKSKSSRKRVHYQKFTKGKDLSTRSEHDMNCIFGIKKSKSDPKSKISQEDNEPEPADDTETVENTGLVTVTSSSSIQEYFAKKMAAKLKNTSQATDPDEDEQKSNSHTDAAVDSNDACEDAKDTDEMNNYTKHKKKKKSKKSKSEKSNDEIIDDVPSEIVTSVDVVDVAASKRKKKKKKKKNDIEEQTQNEMLEERLNCKEKKKKLNGAEMNDMTYEKSQEFDIAESNVENIICTVNDCPTKSKKKKKDKKFKTSNEASSDTEKKEMVQTEKQTVNDLSDDLQLKKNGSENMNSSENTESTEKKSDGFELTENEGEHEKIKNNSRKRKSKSVEKESKGSVEKINPQPCSVPDLDASDVVSETLLVKEKHLEQLNPESSKASKELKPRYKRKRERKSELKLKSKTAKQLMAKEIAKGFKGSCLNQIPGYGNLLGLGKKV